ncbi:glycosyltransferase [Caproicibacter fermentans]|nr:glycosyl transferase family 2 [Clostridium sp. W14A]
MCVYAITKNEEQFVDRWMDAVSEADLVVVADTGSTDRTVEKLRARGAQVYREEIKPWRFDAARNAAMDHIPEDVDICVPNDLDEVFEKGWREKLEAVWQPDLTRVKYLFTYSYKENGTPDKQYMMEKIHCRKGFRWIHPVHELLSYSGGRPEKSVWVPGLILNHYPDLSKPRSQYLPLLELSAKENPEDDRVIFWLGREYLYYKRYDESIATLRRYLDMPSAVWTEERCAAMRFISQCLAEQKKPDEAKEWLYRAIGECPSVREPYYYMANLAYLQGDWFLLFDMCEQALTIKNRSGSYLLEPRCWGSFFYDYGSIACYRLGLYQKSLEYARSAAELSPDDPRIRRNLELIRAMADSDAGKERADHESL